MANKPKIPAQLTEEQKKAQLARAIFQKKASIAEMAIANLCQNPNVAPETIVDKAIAIADELLEKLYTKSIEEA